MRNPLPSLVGVAAVLAAGTVTIQAESSIFAQDHPIPIKVVVMAMYEIGEDTGDRPGEYQFWVERSGFDHKVAFPLGYRDFYLRDDGFMALLTGPGLTQSAVTLAALGLDPRFDFSRTYWIVAGIAGGDPEDVTLGSAAWAEWIVDGDLAYEIDATEIPEDWPYGYVPLGGTKPNSLEGGWTVENIAFQLNPGLVEWAYQTSKDVDLGDHPEMVAFRKQFEGYPKAQEPPTVLKGDTLAASTYWHGFKLNQWANDWMKLHTDGQANFVMSNMEDTGTLTGLFRLAEEGLVDKDRILVLRTASNFTTPPPGESAAWSTTADYPADGRPALEAAYKVALPVVEALLEGWEVYADSLPGTVE
ncbi:MAG: purine nucleoside permease [Opitutales bacterium]